MQEEKKTRERGRQEEKKKREREEREKRSGKETRAQVRANDADDDGANDEE